MGKVFIIGLGPGSPRMITNSAASLLKGEFPVYFRTLHHPAANYYAARIKESKSFDPLYRKEVNFESVYRSIAKSILKAAAGNRIVCYAVPGHPCVGEAAVQRIIRLAPKLGIEVEIIDGISFLEPLLSSLRIDFLDGFTVLDALAVNRLKEPSRNHLILSQIYNRKIASRVKLKLLNLYPADYPVTLIKAAGTGQEIIKRLRLYQLDRFEFCDHLTTLYLPPHEIPGVGDLLEIMARLRAADGCPWDRKQTHRSLRQYLIEEAYEVVAAIDRESDSELVEELGDVLLQVVFHSQIAQEENRFDFNQVTGSIVTKLIRRHPHVFGARKAADAGEVKLLWEEIKADEKHEDRKKNALKVDHALPALLKAFKVQKKAAEWGFDWPTVEGPLDKAREELGELEEAFLQGCRESIEEELGDYLFTIVNLSRFIKVNPEMALGKTIDKFISRFDYIIAQVEKTGRKIEEFTLEELDSWWEEAKKIRKLSKKSRNL